MSTTFDRIEAVAEPRQVLIPTTNDRSTDRRPVVVPALRLLGRAAFSSAAIVLFLIAWELVPRFVLSPATRVFMPPLSEDLQAWWHLAQS
ncbi:MAG: ssuC, partial [Acidimicrobiia bacterium]|nr:ssuC [Acidimicrobiia bacterium]